MNNSAHIINEICAALHSVVVNTPAPLHSPEFTGNEWKYIRDCLDTTYVSSVGKYVDHFEAKLAEFTGAKFVVAVVNGTAALHVSLLLANVKPGDEVIVPTLSFAATANAVCYCGALPHFVDSEPTSLGLNVPKIREYLLKISENINGSCVNKVTGKIIRAILPMHTFGHIGEIYDIINLATEFNLTMIEDAAEALGSFYNARHSGTFGTIGTLSFNGNKIITTGGGGALLINDETIARRAKHITTTAKLPHPWEYWHDEVGYNYRMPNINAALGCGQIEQLPRFLEEKRQLLDLYKNALNGVRGVKIFEEPINCMSNYWLQTLVLDADYASNRDEILNLTNSIGIMTRPVWQLLHKLPHFSHMPRMNLSCAEDLEQRLINIPSSANLAREIM